VPDQPPKPPRRPGPGLRADARRNLDKLRAAAAEAFSERGLDTPLEQIAARAGVSIGTLYRRIPAAAQRAGTVRPDVTVQDIFLIFWSNANIIRATHAVAPGAWRRSLALTLDGLRTEAAHPRPPRPDPQQGCRHQPRHRAHRAEHRTHDRLSARRSQSGHPRGGGTPWSLGVGRPRPSARAP